MNELALFTGGGGGILGGLLNGWRTRCAVEIDAYARRVLLARQRDGSLKPFPIWDDVCTFDGKPWRGAIDIVTGGSHARTSLAPTAQVLGLTENGAVSGESSRESFVKWDRGTSLWKTAQLSLFGGLTEFSEIWPEWGMMHGGECSQLAPLVHHIHGPGCSLWPTPRASGRDNCGGSNARVKAQRLGTYVGRMQNPQLSEWLMGWPIGMTDCAAPVTAKFRQWYASHGIS